MNKKKPVEMCMNYLSNAQKNFCSYKNTSLHLIIEFFKIRFNKFILIT